MPASVMHSYPVPRVHYLALDGPRTTAGMAWRHQEPSAIVEHFLDITREIAAGQNHRPDVWPERHIQPGSPPGATRR